MDRNTVVFSLRKTIPAAIILSCLVVLLVGLRRSDSGAPLSFDYRPLTKPISAQDHTDNTTVLHEQGVFTPSAIRGFDSQLASTQMQPGEVSCQVSETHGTIGVQRAIGLNLNMYQVAESVAGHPLVQYPLQAFLKKNATVGLDTLIDLSWDTFGTSCVLLPSHDVYFCVSRVLFHPGKPKDRTIISFMRGQIFDRAWRHLEGYEMKWPGAETMTFPTTFDVEVHWRVGKLAHGPEDPRLILEDVPGAEPLIIFNMMAPEIDWKRAMFIHRPFTKSTTLLTVQGVERSTKEKNWSAFFIAGPTSEPNKYIHFVWRYAPLAILKCHLETGTCDIVYEQEPSPELLADYSFANASIRGGTQSVPVPGVRSTGIQAFLSIPRHHVEYIRGTTNRLKPSYRPELAVIVTNTTHFFMSYISGPLELGPSDIIPAEAQMDAIGEGRILLASSITTWDVDVHVPTMRDDGVEVNIMTDVLSFTLSFADAKDYIVRVSGVLDHLRHLPGMAAYFDGDTRGQSPVDPFSSSGAPAVFKVASDAGWDVRACAERAAQEYTAAHMKQKPGIAS